MVSESDIAYIAGLFDGEGCVSYKQIMKRRGKHPAYKTWDIRMEISMTEESIIRWVHEVLKVGTFNKKTTWKWSTWEKNAIPMALWLERCLFCMLSIIPVRSC